MQTSLSSLSALSLRIADLVTARVIDHIEARVHFHVADHFRYKVGLTIGTIDDQVGLEFTGRILTELCFRLRVQVRVRVWYTVQDAVYNREGIT